MKNFWKRIFYKICPSIFYGMGRTTNSTVMWFINNNYIYPKDLIDHLNIIHPRKWFDDEVDALFFAVYDFLTRIKKYKVIIKQYDRWTIILISNGKHSYRAYSLTKFGLAKNICSAYDQFIYHTGY